MPTGINPDGSGTARADIQFGSLTWEACSSRLTECRPWGRGREIGTGGAPAGTVFRVRNAIGEEAVTPEWKGPLRQLAPPRVVGALQANDYVSPVPGLWRGGWGEEPAEMQLSACETEAGEGCVSLTSRRYMRQGCDWSQSFLLGARFAGWYLRVADRQSGGFHAEAASAVYSPSGASLGLEEVWGRSRTVSAAVVGQIAPATSPAGGECGPPPPPTATISAAGVARVECAAGCSVTLTGTRNGRRRQVSGRIGEGSLLQPQAARELQLTRGMLSGLGLGQIRLTVEVDGKRLARRTLSASSS